MEARGTRLHAWVLKSPVAARLGPEERSCMKDSITCWRGIDHGDLQDLGGTQSGDRRGRGARLQHLSILHGT